ncbi:transcriptional regulator, IclR family [Allomeiothermus silvanus DSM 9946]|uniref:acetate--CoA ligase n=1 Tax=Allomeiothermus silvanus (strain ATCC 700542 / DSM 9946 / NBRC 106475 / NCIMB 13440 / VI-R2) TaxID=526227 RepID=D7BFC1_ALLS1|nr:AMP-binding protein [Allomeiothermus silvanus]ADH63474.1 transcriptional regulator, IclR family [Allomeiothermus silvanus DSM 9946]
MGRSKRLSTVEAALRVLAYLAAHPEGLEAREVARMLGKSLSTAYALLASLVAEGFAEREGSSYRVSKAALAPAHSTPKAEHFERLQDALEELYLRTRERVYLALLTPEGGLELATRGRQGLPKPEGLERQVQGSLYAFALGKAVLAYLPEDELTQQAGELRPRTPYTLTDPLALREELARVRQMGFAVELEEYALGLSGLAAPIFGSEGQVIGSLGVVVPSRRFPYAFTRLLRAVQEVSQASAHQVGPTQPRREPPSLESAPLPSPSKTPDHTPESPQVWADPTLRHAANLQDYRGTYQRSLEDPEGFWAEWAERFCWFERWRKVQELNLPLHRWFVGGKTNLTYNALDRHASSPRRNQLALVALSGEGKTHKLTYRELLDRTARLASALKRLGVVAGDRVAVYMPTGLEASLAMLACARIGAVHVLIPAGLGAAALRERLEDTGAKLLIAADRSYQAGQAVSLSGVVEEAVQGLEVEVLWHRRGNTPRHPEFWEVLEAESTLAPAEPLDSEHPLFILYTSGSTGKPKGVVHVHGGYMVGTTYHLRTFFDAKDTDVFWSTSDIGWIVGHSYIVYAPLLEGLTSVLREGAPDYPNPGIFWQLVERYRVNVMFTAPTAVRMFMKFGPEWPSKADLSSLRLLAVAGEPLNPEAWLWAWEHLADSGRRAFVADNWWQTELGGPTLGTPLTHPAKPGAAGVALPGVEAAIVSPEGQEVPAGQGGLLVLKRPFPHMMRTVWGNPERYAQYWREIPGEVYAAGDVASCDEDGYFSVLGRADDVLNVAGHRIGTADVESALVSHPAVAEAAVIGVADSLKGERIKAFVVLRAGQLQSEALVDA